MELVYLDEKNISFVVENEEALFGQSLGEEMIKDELGKDYALYLLIKEGCVNIGYISAHIFPPSCEILNFFIIPSFQSKGYGKQALEMFINMNKNIKEFTLDVRETNVRAISLYHKMGFKDLIIREKYYHDGTSAIVMMKGRCI